jgi:hypothetical protein
MTKKKPKKSMRGEVKVRWQERVNKCFAAWFSAQKENRRLSEMSDDKRPQEAFNRNRHELCVASGRFIREPKPPASVVSRVWSAIVAPLVSEIMPWPTANENAVDPSRYTTNPEADSIFRTLVFLKYGVTFRELILRSETDKEAHHNLLKAHKAWYRFRWENHLLQGMKLRFDLDHFQIILQGLDFGLKELDQTELAKCLDKICPCNQKHSAEYLKKLRTRIIKRCEELVK